MAYLLTKRIKIETAVRRLEKA